MRSLSGKRMACVDDHSRIDGVIQNRVLMLLFLISSGEACCKAIRHVPGQVLHEGRLVLRRPVWSLASLIFLLKEFQYAFKS